MATTNELSDADAVFDAAFEEAITGTAPPAEGESPADPPDEGSATVGDEEGSADPFGEQGEEAKPTAEGEEGGEADKVEAAAEEPDYKALYEREVRIRKNSDTRTSALQRQLNELQAAKAQQPVVADPVAATPREQAPDPDDAFLETFQKDYHPDVVKAIDLIARRRANELLQQRLQSELKPVASTVQEMLQQAHFQAVEAVHPDWQEVSQDPKFTEWVDTRPAHLRKAYKEVVANGSPREVVDLLTDYKDSTNPKPKPTATTPVRSVSTRQVQAATAVPVPRGGLPRAASAAMDDFDAAWDEAIAGSG